MIVDDDVILRLSRDGDTSVAIGKDRASQWFAELANPLVRARFGYHPRGDTGTLDSFVAGETGFDVARYFVNTIFDTAAVRGCIMDITLTRDALERKTIRITYRKRPDIRYDARPYTTAVTDVTIFSGSPILRMDYVQTIFGHIAEHGDMTGMVGTYAVHGADRGELPFHGAERNFYEPGFGCEAALYRKGDLSYKGWMILGACFARRRETQDPVGTGYARVLREKDVRCVKLLWSTGFEIFLNDGPVESYLLPVTQGPEEVLSTGHALVDGLARA